MEKNDTRKKVIWGVIIAIIILIVAVVAINLNSHKEDDVNNNVVEQEQIEGPQNNLDMGNPTSSIETGI